MFTPTVFYPANIINGGSPSLFTNECKSSHDAKSAVQRLIDNNDFGRVNHVIAGFAYFNEASEIVYVFPTKNEILESLFAVKKGLSTGATRSHAKLKSLKKSAVFALNFLNKKETAKSIDNASTFKQAIEALDSIDLQ